MSDTCTRENIITAARSELLYHGYSGFAIRNVAQEAKTSSAAIYKYFSSREDLLQAARNEIWKEILHPFLSKSYLSLEDCVKTLFLTIQNADTAFPGFFCLHTVGYEMTNAGEDSFVLPPVFDQVKAQMETSLLHKKASIRPIFSSQYTIETFLDQILSLLLISLLKHSENCSHVLDLIQNLLYEPK